MQTGVTKLLTDYFPCKQSIFLSKPNCSDIFCCCFFLTDVFTFIKEQAAKLLHCIDVKRSSFILEMEQITGWTESKQHGSKFRWNFFQHLQYDLLLFFLSAAPFCGNYHFEQTYTKDLAIVLRWRLFLTQPGLKPAASGLWDGGIGHQPTPAPEIFTLERKL